MWLRWTRDEIILACALTKKHGWRELNSEHPEVLELSELLRASPLHPMELRDHNFRNAKGVARKTADIATQHPHFLGIPTHGNRLDGRITKEFLADPVRMEATASSIRQLLRSTEVATSSELEIAAEEFAADEGGILPAHHLRRERSPRLRREKIAAVIRTGAPIACEVCTFDFGEEYGLLGEGFIEVHHVLPLHVSGPVKTRLQDLALLCSNCHRMIHRSSPWLSPSDLRTHLR